MENMVCPFRKTTKWSRSPQAYAKNDNYDVATEEFCDCLGEKCKAYNGGYCSLMRDDRIFDSLRAIETAIWSI